MRLLIEVFIVSALIYLGWEKPFRDWLPSHGSGVTKATPAPAVQLQPFARSTSTPATALAPVATPQSAASRSGSWMFDPNRRSPLDAPRKSATPH
jgi:hypothetical protein